MSQVGMQMDSLDGDVIQVTYCYSLNVGTPAADLSKQLIASHPSISISCN